MELTILCKLAPVKKLEGELPELTVKLLHPKIFSIHLFKVIRKEAISVLKTRQRSFIIATCVESIMMYFLFMKISIFFSFPLKSCSNFLQTVKLIIRRKHGDSKSIFMWHIFHLFFSFGYFLQRLATLIFSFL